MSSSNANIAETRRLAAVMFTDMVGFSRLMHVDEDRALRLLDECDDVLAANVAVHGGRVLKKMGDAMLAEFTSAATAVTCAIDVQTRIRDRNEDKAPGERIVLRIGIHLGDMIVRGDDLFGDGVNVAARLESLCEPGGICLSEAVYHAIGANAAVQPIRVGEVELKNILQKQVIYRIPSLYAGGAIEEPSADSTPARRRLGAVERIDVLPPPTRGLGEALVLTSVIVPFSAALCFWVGVDAANRPYRLFERDVAEPNVIVEALQVHVTPAHQQVWEALDRPTREAVVAWDTVTADTSAHNATHRSKRRAFNELIWAERPLLEGRALSGLEPSVASEVDTRRRNRLMLEAAFPGSIRRHVSDPSTTERAVAQVRHLWSAHRSLAFGSTGLAVLWVVMGTYSFMLTTLRISFPDLRDVDTLLDYHIPDLGFRPPHRQGDDLVFRATLWTTLNFHILRLRARVAGNTVLLTGPAPIMRRLRKRILLLGDPDVGTPV